MASRPRPKTALVTGASGLLGRAVQGELSRRGWDVQCRDRLGLDVTDRDAVCDTVAGLRPAVVFHCAAFAAVDDAESRPDEAFRVNRDGAGNVARACADSGAVMVYPSTDYVFSGERETPYAPDDPTGPVNAYGASKLAGEEAVSGAGGTHLVARTSWLFGEGAESFVDRMLALAASRGRLSIVDDQTSRPTWSADLAEALVDLVERGVGGTVHVAGGGTATRFELITECLRIVGSEARVDPVSSARFDAPAARPSYSVLDISGTEGVLGRPMPRWRDSLRRYLERLGEAAPSLEGSAS